MVSICLNSRSQCKENVILSDKTRIPARARDSLSNPFCESESDVITNIHHPNYDFRYTIFTSTIHTYSSTTEVKRLAEQLHTEFV